MGEEAATVTQSLLGRRGHGGGGQLQTVSSVTTTLVLSTFVAACISFGFGCVMGYSSPTQSAIMEDLDLSIAEFSLFGSMLNIGSILGALVSGRTTDLLGRKCTMWVLNLFYIMGWFAIAFAKVLAFLSLILCQLFLYVMDSVPLPRRLHLGVLTELVPVVFHNPIMLDFHVLERFRGCLMQEDYYWDSEMELLVPLYVAEITPKNLRGRFSVLVQYCNLKFAQLWNGFTFSYYSKSTTTPTSIFHSRVS
ncbi:hypothetical protein SCA6_003165 [Theobroma cacao]